jgi:hypothetical protein
MKRADPHRALLRALMARYPGLVIVSSSSEPWASVTFSGARHILICEGAPDLAGIAEGEFDLPGHVVADVHVEQRASYLSIEALTIEGA